MIILWFRYIDNLPANNISEKKLYKNKNNQHESQGEKIEKGKKAIQIMI